MAIDWKDSHTHQSYCPLSIACIVPWPCFSEHTLRALQCNLWMWCVCVSVACDPYAPRRRYVYTFICYLTRCTKWSRKHFRTPGQRWPRNSVKCGDRRRRRRCVTRGGRAQQRHRVSVFVLSKHSCSVSVRSVPSTSAQCGNLSMRCSYKHSIMDTFARNWPTSGESKTHVEMY